MSARNVSRPPQKVFVPILRSLVDGTEVTGPICIDAASKRVYAEDVRSSKRWRLVGWAGITMKEPPTHYTLIAETVTNNVTSTRFVFSSN